MSTTISEQENEVRDRQSISIDAGDMIGGAMAADEVIIDESYIYRNRYLLVRTKNIEQIFILILILISQMI